MSFISSIFLLFFATLLVVYWLVPRKSWQNFILLAASYIFYGWIHPWCAILLGLLTLIDYGLTRLLVHRPDRRKIWLMFSLLANLGTLAFFKYYNFFGDGLAQALSAIGLETSTLLVKVLLPAGLSFFTLKKLAYILDVSRGTIQPTGSLTDFAIFVSFFPQLVAGPIDRAQKLLPQIEQQRIWKASFFYTAWPLLVMGLFKKIVIADSLKAMVDRIYGIEHPSKILVMAGTLAFAIQILADFSAYTDLARGLASLLGFETSENFRQPYQALTPTEFWNRWHITLSSWLRDYVFFPLRRAMLRRKELPPILVQVIPPLATFFISGLWHGAGWTFTLWGVYHGLLITIYQLAGRGGSWKPSGRVKTGLAWLVMFGFTLFGWLLFRAPSLDWLGNLLLYAPWTRGVDDQAISLITLTMTLVYSFPMILHTALERWTGKYSWLAGLFYAAALAAVLVYLNSAPSDFIYFQF